MDLKQDEKNIVSRLCRQFIYFVLIFVFIFGIHLLAHVYGRDTFDENGVVENVQLFLLLCSSFSFLWQIEKNKDFTTVLLLLFSCCLLAACRELDATFDRLIPIVHWKFAYVFPLLAGIYALKHYADFRQSLFKFFTMPAFNMMYLTVILICPIAQCIGHGSFVRDVLGPHRVDDIKEFCEEAMEVVGYFLIFLSSVEMHFNLKKRKRG